MLPGSAQTVRDLSEAPMAAKLAARQQTSNTPRRALRTVLLFIADLRKRYSQSRLRSWNRPAPVTKVSIGGALVCTPRKSQEKPGGSRHRVSCKTLLPKTLLPYMPPTLKVYKVPPCGIEERLAALVIAVAPMAPNLSLRSSPAVTGRPIQPPMPDHTDTYCLPFTEYVIGLPMMPEPSLRDHSTLPVDLSTARKSPPRLP